MLDQVLLAQAALQGIRVLTTIAVVATALLVAGLIGLAVTSRVTGPVGKSLRLVSKVSASLGVLGMGLLVAAILAASMSGRAETYEWTIDLRRDAPLQPFLREPCSTWKIGARDYRDCIYEGRIRLNAQFPGDRLVDRSGRALWASGHEGRLTSLHLFLEPMSRSEAQTTAEALIDTWSLRREQIVDWAAEAANPDPRASYFTPEESARVEPWLEVSVRRIDPQPRGDRTWAVSLKWHWDDNQ
jgi:hypothetical protein